MKVTIKQMANDLRNHWSNEENTKAPKDYAIYYLWKKFECSFKNALSAYYVAYK